MLDIRFIRDNADLVQKNASAKGYNINIGELLSQDDLRRSLQQQADDLREKRNAISSQTQGGRPSDEAIEQSKVIKQELTTIESSLKTTDEQFTVFLKSVPNMATSDVPYGKSEDDNVIAKTVGEMTKFDFTPKNHADLSIDRGWIDKERAAKVTGARFAYIKGDLVKLQFAIIQFVIDILTDESKIQEIAKQAGLSVATRPFVPILPPLMIRTDMYDAMDRLEPQDDRYKLEGDDLWLQGSAEHVLGSMHANEIFDETQLPLRYVGYATSFRREAGTYGKDTEGILRMHQFDKLEMESFTTGEDGLNEHLLFVAIQEYLLSSLGLPYHVVQKCTADIGKPNARGIDMDVWLPGQDKYRETHTADYMTDYQSRRLNTRVRRDNGELELVHTNDATAFALGRTMVAIIENFQTADGHVVIPSVIRPYIANREML
jgi:seryl-tRNA synthetase